MSGTQPQVGENGATQQRRRGALPKKATGRRPRRTAAQIAADKLAATQRPTPIADPAPTGRVTKDREIEQMAAFKANVLAMKGPEQIRYATWTRDFCADLLSGLTAKAA
jgi:hypothetical protein